MAHNDFGFSLSENSVNEINSLIEQYSQDIVSIMNGFQDDLIEHISTANYDKLLKAVDGIIELYNNSVRYDLKTTILDKWQEACESMSSFAERMDMGEESEQVASEIEESLASVFEVEIENRLHEVDIDGRTSASIADFDSVNEIFDSVVKKVQELSDEFSEEAERLGEDNEFYKFIIPVVIAYSSGICSYFNDATKNLENLEDNYISKMAEKRDAVYESRQDVDLSSLLDFSDLTYAGMGSISQNVPSEKRDVSPVVDPTGISGEGDKTPNKYEKLIKALSKFDGNECTYPELRRKYDEHLDKYKKGLDTRVKAEYDKRDKQLKQYHTQLEQQLKNRHKELDGRYIKGTISLQQAEYLYAESCEKANQLYAISQRTLWAEYQNICQQAKQMYNGEVARCKQIANKVLYNRQLACKELYKNRNKYVQLLLANNITECFEELTESVSEIRNRCNGLCTQCSEVVDSMNSKINGNHKEKPNKTNCEECSDLLAELDKSNLFPYFSNDYKELTQLILSVYSAGSDEKKINSIFQQKGKNNPHDRVISFVQHMHDSVGKLNDENTIIDYIHKQYDCINESGKVADSNLVELILVTMPDSIPEERKILLGNKYCDETKRFVGVECERYTNYDEKYRKILQQRKNEADPVTKMLFDKISGKLRIVSDNWNKTPHYDPKLNGIYLDASVDTNNKRGEGSTFYHELGHMIDYTLAKECGGQIKTISADPIFSEALEDDKKRIINMLRENPEGKTKFIEQLQKNDMYHSLSDIIGGMRIHHEFNDNKQWGKYGHHTKEIGGKRVYDESYWDREKQLEKETFAHLYEAFMGNTQKRDILKNVMPKTCDAFSKVLRKYGGAYGI